jgi:Glycosyl transferase family 8
MESRGIIYIAIGEQYRQMAIRSAESVIDTYSGQCPQIIILTDNLDSYRVSPIIRFQEIELKLPADPACATAYIKVNLNDLSPFTETLYLDCDTKAIADLSGVWEFIGDSIAVAPAYDPLRKGIAYLCNAEANQTSKILSSAGNYNQYNTGVFLFKKSPYIDNVFDLWLREWDKFKNHENMAFTRVTTQGVKVDMLDSKYNQFYPDVDTNTVLVHYIGEYKKYLKQV